MTTLERIRNGRIALLLDEPFFGSLLMHLKPIEDKACKTFSTDGKSLRVNPEFLDALNDQQLKTILAHEVMHCALLHPYRRGQRDLRKFNVAADFAINNFLDAYNQHVAKRGGTVPFPLDGPLAGGCLNHAYDGMCAEEIYNLMPESPKGGGQQPQSGGAGGKSQAQPGPGQGKPQPGNGKGKPQPPQPGDDADSPGEFTDGAHDEAGQAEAEADWKVALQQAAAAGKSRGRLPAEIERLIGELLDPKVHWRELLRRFLTAVAKDDYSFAKPNRRYSGSTGRNRIVMPGLHSPKLGKIVCAVDTSGSIDQKQFDEFMAEVRSVFFDCRPESFVVAQCDARLHEWQEIGPFDDLKITAKGGGGTDFAPVFNRAIEEQERPAALIYLTDLEGSFPDHTPPFPVLWAVSGKKTEAPFGEVLNVL